MKFAYLKASFTAQPGRRVMLQAIKVADGEDCPEGYTFDPKYDPESEKPVVKKAAKKAAPKKADEVPEVKPPEVAESLEETE